MGWRRGTEEVAYSHHAMGSNSSKIRDQKERQPSMEVDTESGESPTPGATPVGVNRAAGQNMESFHVGEDYGKTEKVCNGDGFTTNEENPELPQNFEANNNSKQQEDATYGKENSGQNGGVYMGLKGADFRGSVGEGKNTQMGGGIRKNLMKEGVRELHGNGKKIIMEGDATNAFMRGNAGKVSGQQEDARFMGANKMGSPCVGPTLADVEKTMARTTLGGGPVHDKGANNKQNATWKRKARVVQTQSENGSNMEFLGKRKVGKTAIGEGMGKKMCNTCFKQGTEKLTLLDEETEETEHGSGMAAAVEQPRRPQ
jgi:hypothetical protein